MKRKINFTCPLCGCHVLTYSVTTEREVEVGSLSYGLVTDFEIIKEDHNIKGFFCGKCGNLIAKTESEVIDYLKDNNMLSEVTK
jgi:hypothetical protein